MGFLRQAGGRIALVVVWTLVMAVGIRALLLYSFTPGQLAKPPREWPALAPIEPAADRSTLLVFIHPQCPCSRASLGELARIIACCKDQVQTSVFFYSPPSDSSDWAHTDLWNTATGIPTVRVYSDPDAAAARRFGARTSGQVLLYDRKGNLQFNGGITALRGHSGDNDGRDAIVSLLRGQAPRQHTTPVFGCALFGGT